MRNSVNDKIPLREFLDQNSTKKRQRIIILLLFLVTASDGLDMTIIGHLFPSLREQWAMSVEQITFTVSAGVIAMAIGAFISGPIADKWGRKSVLTWAFLLFCFTTAGMSAAWNVESLIAFRLISCLGLGAVIPVALAMMTDLAPTHKRAQSIALVFAGTTTGSMLGGYLSAALIPTAGWQVTVLVAGLLPLLVVPFFIKLVPEPADTLITREAPAEHIYKTLHVLAPRADVSKVDITVVTRSETTKQNVFSILFTRGRLTVTVLIWILGFITIGISQIGVQYLPLLLQEPTPGLTAAESGLIVSTYFWGGLIAQLGIALVLQRISRFAVGFLAASWAGIAMIVIAVQEYSFATLFVLLFLLGLAIPVTPSMMNTVASMAYPPEARATGLATAGIAGRAGALSTGIAVGGFMSAGYGLQAVFGFMSVPLFIAGAIFLGLGRLHRRFERRQPKRQENKTAETRILVR